MPDILHRVGIKTTPGKVFEALTTIEGLAHWWISDTAGDAQQGGTILFGFSESKGLLIGGSAIPPGTPNRAELSFSGSAI